MTSGILRDVKESGGGLKEEIADFKRRRIREEACHLFYKKGYEGTTIDAIAQSLDVTKPFIYSHYKNKSELLFDICKTGIELSLKAMDEPNQHHKTPEERLKLLIDRVMRIIIDNQEYIVVYEREEKNLEPGLARIIREQRSLFDHRLADLLREGHQKRAFVITNASLTATTIAGMMTWVAFWYSPSGRWAEVEIIAHVMAMIDAVVLAGVQKLPERPPLEPSV
ncbi:MAG: AcrR family transcriptional regulator [Alcanivorax sp.]|jgi:AcrR family transcriptional regulator